jgi:shikimate dehydrogenase
MNDDGIVFHASDLAGGGKIFRKLTREEKACPARLAIFGDPVAHSKSPPMQNAALLSNGHNCQYVRIHVPPDELGTAMGNLVTAGFLGANLTIPHKQNALDFIDEISPEARLMGAINTVSVRDEKLHGFNTDGPGFAAAVREEFDIGLGTLRVLILGGGGGAGRAITVQCALAGCPTIFVANRTVEKAQLLSEEIEESLGKSMTPISLAHEALQNALSCVDLVVNATPLGMKQNDPSPLPDGLLTKGHLVYDTVYSGGTSALIGQAIKAGAKGSNGLSMLLHQGALAYEIWFNETAPLETMREALVPVTAR